jgi:RNA-directed DNA polymerase
VSLTLSASGDELVKQFFALRTRQDVAELLEIDDSRLVYHLYIVSYSEKYTTFDIPKKSGGVRRISAPATALKIIQRKLNQVLQHAYESKAPVHGFVYGKNIVTNAQMHKGKRYVFNVDLKDFFPSINFGRVRGMFTAIPYNLNPDVATVLAQICCFDNQLPQGAPTSPIISNMICAKMDSQLRRLAQSHRCIYTRYADDITFSTSMRGFPDALASVNPAGQMEVGSELRRIIEENGFEINYHAAERRGFEPAARSDWLTEA